MAGKVIYYCYPPTDCILSYRQTLFLSFQNEVDRKEE